MLKKNVLTRILAIAGTILVWLPVIALVVISGSVLIRRGEFHVDYLIPAELFPVFLGGGLLLLWASIRARCYRLWIGVGLGAVGVLIVSGQAIAMLTGLATGVTERGGWQWAIVLGAIILYDLAVVAVGVGGILLTLYLFQNDSVKE
jgi:hypothetical protein